MAKKSSIEKNNRRAKMAKQYAAKRAVLKAMAVPVTSSYTPMNTTLGGVPMGVPMPPMLAP